MENKFPVFAAEMLIFTILSCVSFGQIGFDTQEIIDRTLYPSADLGNPEVRRNISLTLSAYEGACKSAGINPMPSFIQQIKAGKAKINLTGEALTYYTLKPVVYSLAVNQTVVYLDLNYNFLGDTGAYDLCGLIQKNRLIRTYDLGECCIGSDGIAALKEAKGEIQLLNLSPPGDIEYQQEIYLDACGKFSSEPDRSMIKFFRGNCRNLKFPYFMTNTASMDGKAAGSNAFVVNIGTKPVELLIFSEIIRKTKSIRQILIAGNLPLCPEAEEFMASFASNNSITNMIIQAPRLEEAHTVRLFEALSDNSSIKALSIDYTTLSSAGMEALTAMLSKTKSIRYFRFAYNNNPEIDSRQLIKTLYLDNNTIERLVLKGMTVADDPYLPLLRGKFPDRK